MPRCDADSLIGMRFPYNIDRCLGQDSLVPNGIGNTRINLGNFTGEVSYVYHYRMESIWCLCYSQRVIEIVTSVKNTHK